jgi:uncharacterized protein
MDIPLYLGLALALPLALQLAVGTIGMFRRQWREEALFRLRRRKLELELSGASRGKIAVNTAWEGWRTFRVAQLVRETADTMSVYFEPEDGGALPRFLPGQYVTLSLRVPGEMRPIVRCYSLSHAPVGNYYRCTVKEVPPPTDRPELPFGKASRHINRRLAEGEMVDLKAPHGNFTLDVTRKTPVVLIGAGIGVTPLFSMLQAVAATKDLSVEGRQVIAFLQFRSGEHHPLRNELAALARQNKNIQIVTVYSTPAPGDVIGRDFDRRGRLTLEIVQKSLRGSGHDFYICGPGSLMESMVVGLEQSGIAPQHIHFEAFGPASVKRAGRPKPGDGSDNRSAGPSQIPNGTPQSAPAPSILFELSGITAAWSDKTDSLLELAEAHQIPVESGCRAGNCGTCAMAIKSGKVVYSTPPGSPPPAGSCLPCICVPDGPLVLQA